MNVPDYFRGSVNFRPLCVIERISKFEVYFVLLGSIIYFDLQ